MGAAAPDITVIIPTHARPRELSACLDALSRSNYERDRFEVIVVDDGSPIPVDCVVGLFAHRLDIRMLREENRGPAAARNAGAALARGRILAFTDDDCLPDPDWLRALVCGYSSNATLLIGGRTINGLADNIYSTASHLVMELVYSHYNANPERALFFASNNIAFSRQSFLDIGGFDARFRTAEDRELCDRWRHAGHSLSYAPDAVVRHAHHLTLSTFLRQHFRYGRGALRFHHIRALRKSGKLIQEFAFYGSLPVRIRKQLSGSRAGRAMELLCLLLLWQAANAAGYVWEFIHSTDYFRSQF